ncbi:ATP-binding protein [Streptomyces sp. NPDC053474]|uniref:ATP-binding protein n=1 Tax=Streptomyces sp. NPDC053474 TaxID=3365704 RepID=UPI0037D875C7
MKATMPDPTQQFFTARPESVRAARDFTTRTLTARELDVRTEDIRLCVSELASNAVTHGTTPGHGFLVRIVIDDDVVRLEVHDSRSKHPVPGEPADTDVTGRGLLIVAALSDDWGVTTREPLGKIVWSCFKVGRNAGSPR